jgi:hypothetical protein
MHETINGAVETNCCFLASLGDLRASGYESVVAVTL